MYRREIIAFSVAMTMWGIGLPGGAAAQQKSIKDQLVGTWTLLLDDGITADGSQVPRFGPNPVGTLIFAADGHYSLQIMRVDGRLAKLSTGPNGTADQSNPAVAGLLTHFGTYTVNSDKTLFFDIEASSNPNLVGSRKGRPITAITDEFLSWDDPPPTTLVYVNGKLAWKKAK